MALKPMNPGAVSTATVVSDLPDMPQDLADRTAVAKWWFDTRLVFQRLLSDIERRRNVGGTEPATEYSPTWDSITGKPDKFPPEDHSHAAGKATPLVQVVAEDPLVAGTTDPDTGNADIGFHEQTAATFLAGPVIGPPQLPVFRPILLSDLPASVRDMPTGGNPGTYDDLNGGTGGGTPEGIIAVQARGGSWSLVGFAEFTAISTPPRRYLRKQYSGSLITRTWNAYNNGPAYACGESTLLCTRTRTLSGACIYSATSGELVTNNTHDITTYVGSGCSGSDADWGFGCAYGLPGSYPGELIVERTAQHSTAAGDCNYSDPVLTCSQQTGAIRVDLLDEDTEDYAIGRLWVVDPAWGEATTAIRTIRTDGITGLYREARYRTEHTAGAPAVTYPTLIGLVPWQRYQLTVTLESRPVDSAGAPTGDGTWSAAGTRQHYFIANLLGEGGIDWQVVEPTAGYETRIASTLLEAV